MQKQITIRVCNNCSCAKKGSGGVMKKIEETVGLTAGTKNSEYDLDYSACLGCCDFGPNLLVDGNLVLGADKNTVMDEVAKAANSTTPTLEEKEADLDKVLNDLI